MKNYDRYIEIATRVLIHIRHSEGQEAVELAAIAMIDAATAISSHELRKSANQAFPDTPQFPDDGSMQFVINGERITVSRESIRKQHLPPAA